MQIPTPVIPPALSPMAAYAQWICWKLVPKANGKFDKVPVCPRTGVRINAQDPHNWMDATTALVRRPGFTGIEVVSTPSRRRK